MRGELGLHNALIVFPEGVRAGSLLIRNGVIEGSGKVPLTASSVDCEGDFVTPGLIEAHTDNLERHLKPRPGTVWPAARAILSHDAELAAAGITTAWDAISLGNDLGDDDARSTYREEIEAISSAREEGLLRVDHRLHFRCELSSPNLQRHLEAALGAGRPELISLMDHTPGQGQWTDIDRFRRHYAGRYDLHPHQLDELIARRQQDRQLFSMTNRRIAVELAHRLRCVIASHDDTGLPSILQAREDACTLAEFPVSVEAARAARAHGMHVIAGAPNLVRGGSHSGNVAVADLIRSGMCDILSSDYYPASLIQAAFMLTQEFGVPLHEAISVVTLAPARALRLEDRGRVQVGLLADLIRVRATRRGPVIKGVWCKGERVC